MVGHWSGMGGDYWTRASDGGWAEKSVGHWAGMVGDGWNGPANGLSLFVAETGRRLGQTGGGIRSGAG